MSARIITDQPAGRKRTGRQGRALPLALAVALVAAAAVTAWACSAANTAGGAAPGAPAGTSSSQAAGAGREAANAAHAPAGAVATTLTPTGFTPNQLSHAAGRFNLVVKNRSGQPEVTLRLSKGDGEKVTEAKLTDKVRAWSGSVELAPGTYVLSEAGHADWTCRVEITAP